jgi:hypothetical protein
MDTHTANGTSAPTAAVLDGDPSGPALTAAVLVLPPGPPRRATTSG